MGDRAGDHTRLTGTLVSVQVSLKQGILKGPGSL